ncbi:DUF2398 family protein [Streptomonospora nanhaiensis]|uniref:Uncharacterized protein (TIGR02678 family) n=1 Tax=Streptomonospora nanhaiensis TaxID=1323731 RepID=A0A853BMA1_9ACTN|nr:DUF2398 family protein [Streptomonospora nanhaiensis]MBV2361829.1 TIGR02678 family protein [Streptomonospora nanhaiensis]NYI96353.1 uncharacterized protein (TIGR02678 family) [Streptomonospora nanhaiensis]
MTATDDIALIGERQAAARRLLADPIVTARTHPDDFAVIRTHSDWLIQRFRRVLGYELKVAADHARLVKTGLVSGTTRPLTRPSGAYFSPRTYSYLALSLAVLVEAPARVTAAGLAADVSAAAAEAGLDLDPRRRMGERRAYAAALRRLADWGALSEEQGRLPAYAADSSHEVHLAVHHEVVRRVVAHPPHATDDPAAFVADMDATDPAGEDAGEVALRRALAETAVVYRADLSERQRRRLAAHQWRAVAELGDLLGCDAEIRAEGVALIMPGDTGADAVAAFPSAGPVGQAALLLVERLVARLRPAAPQTRVAVPAEVLEEELAHATAARTGGDRSALRHEPDPATLAARVLRLLCDTRLMHHPRPDSGDRTGWWLLAAAARYGGRPSDAAAPAPEPDTGASADDTGRHRRPAPAAPGSGL